jgi:phosphatidylinositol alpha-1,6-mannosyltransferase
VVILGTVNDGRFGLWLRRWFGIPYIVYAHGNEICSILSAPEDHKPALHVLANASRVVAVSRFTAGLVERTGIGADRITVVYPGCDVEAFEPQATDPELPIRLLGRRSGNRVVLTTGNLVERKGHDMVIRALPQVIEAVPDVTYLIVGNGYYRAELERLAQALGVGDHVVFAGRISDAELPAIYSHADVFIMASRQRLEANDIEGFGLVYLEASASGTPVIGGRSGGIPEAIVEGTTGLLVDPEDPADIARALTRCLTEAGLSAELGRAGAEWVRREFSWPKVADRMERVLTETVTGWPAA